MDEYCPLECFNEAFSIFNFIFKELIKYNRITAALRIRYFETVQEAIRFKSSAANRENSKYRDNNNNDLSNSYYLIKSIFYTLVYINDCSILKKLKEEGINLFTLNNDYIINDKGKYSFR